MSEVSTEQEVGTVEPTENTASVSDYFSEYTPVDESGTPIDDEPAPNGEKEEKPAEKPSEKSTDKPVADKPEKVQGFDSRFYTTDEKTGESRFNGDSALEFLTLKDKDDLRFKYERPTFAAKDEPEPDEVEQLAQQQTEYKQTLKKNALDLWAGFMDEAIRGGITDAAQAKQYAMGRVQEIVDSHVNEQEQKWKADYMRKLRGMVEESTGQTQLASQANQGAAALAAKLGWNQAEYGEFFFKQHAEDIYSLFELNARMAKDLASMPDPRTLSVEKYNKALNKWFQRIQADPKDHALLFNLLHGRYTAKNLPKIAEYLRGNVKKEQGEAKTTQRRSPSPVRRFQPAANPSARQEAWAKYQHEGIQEVG